MNDSIIQFGFFFHLNVAYSLKEFTIFVLTGNVTLNFFHKHKDFWNENAKLQSFIFFLR